MFARVGRCVVALTLCSSIGGHWFCLQSAAWAKMVVTYSQYCSFGTAIAKTFDGNHPCDLCKHISKARETEKKRDTQRSVNKADFICTTRRVVLLPPFARFGYPDLASSIRSGFNKTPYPPPREVVA
jgi:hypothetical protein